MKDPVTWLYPAIEPYTTGCLRVSPVHELYYEESGNPGGKPVIFLHGGRRRGQCCRPGFRRRASGQFVREPAVHFM
jgi:proline iminopeptidase